jgi:hypothetical protein
MTLGAIIVSYSTLHIIVWRGTTQGSRFGTSDHDYHIDVSFCIGVFSDGVRMRYRCDACFLNWVNYFHRRSRGLGLVLRLPASYIEE